MSESIIENLKKEIIKAGEARSQESYEEAYDRVFEYLDVLEEQLGKTRYLQGNLVGEDDKKLYEILLRFDTVYYFKNRLNRNTLRDFDNLWNYARDLYEIPKYRQLADFKKIKNDMLLGTEEENPYRIVALGPDEAFWQQKNNRDEKFPINRDEVN